MTLFIGSCLELCKSGGGVVGWLQGLFLCQPAGDSHAGLRRHQQLKKVQRGTSMQELQVVYGGDRLWHPHALPTTSKEYRMGRGTCFCRVLKCSANDVVPFIIFHVHYLSIDPWVWDQLLHRQHGPYQWWKCWDRPLSSDGWQPGMGKICSFYSSSFSWSYFTCLFVWLLQLFRINEANQLMQYDQCLTKGGDGSAVIITHCNLNEHTEWKYFKVCESMH